MKNFFNRRDEEIEEIMEEDDLDIINLDETSGWSKLEIAEELAKQQAENMMEEIGDELAIIDVVEEDLEFEKLGETAEINLKGVKLDGLKTKDVKQMSKKELEDDDIEYISEEVEDDIEYITEDEDVEYITEEDDDIEYMSDDEDDDEDEEEYEEFAPFAFFESIGQFFARWTVLDKVVAAVGVMVLAVAILTVGVYAGKRGLDKQVAAFAPVGAQLENVGVVGSDKLLAVADAKKAMLEAAKLEAELNQEYEENDLSTEVKVVMKMTSVQKDLKIKFVNKKTGKLVGNIPFEVEITDSENKTYNKIDEDKDGIIYLTNIVHGNYQVAMVELDDLEGYTFSTSKEKIKVKENIAYEKIDVTEEIKDQSEVDVSKEDTAQKTETEAVLTDTVEWVASTKKESSSGEKYTQVSKDTIAEPSLSASLNLDLGILRIMQQNMVLADVTPMTNNNDGIMPVTEIAVTGVNISASSASLKVGGSTTLSATIVPSDATNASSATFAWSSSNEEVATVSAGTVTAVAAGNTTITVTATTLEGNFTATCAVTVTEETTTPPESPTVAATGVNLDKSSATLTEGETATLTATVAPDNASNKEVTWSSSNEAVATVTNGKVTAVKEGTATITVTTKDGGHKANCAVTVNKPASTEVAVTEVTLSKTSLELTEEATETLTATVKPDNATNQTVTWSSSNENVAKVENGKVTAVSAGSTGTATATITYSFLMNFWLPIFLSIIS